MKYIWLLLVVVLSACKQKKEEEKNLHQTITGNWFVVYPGDELLNSRQKKIYGEIQDSLTDPKCLKLISFTDDGNFFQLDSSEHKGKWGTKDDEYVVINEGGNGFENFRAEFTSYTKKDSTLKITETVKVRGVSLRFVWNLKRMDKKSHAVLFDEKTNNWRKRPAAPETDGQLRERLAAMLEYYAGYFQLISEEASYFMPVRVFLPMKYYQHAIGMKNFDKNSKFVSFFFSEEEAQKAYTILGAALKAADFNEVKGGNSYTREYAQMLRIIALAVRP
jgi:hypothetical protein